MLLRNLLLSLAERPAVTRFVARRGMQMGFARRFIAGETLAEAVAAARDLNVRGIEASLDLLGENVADADHAAAATDQYIGILEEIRHAAIQSNISVKLTQMGLDLDVDLCASHLFRLVERAAQLENFVRIDMEGSAYTQRTLDLFMRAHERFGAAVGVVVQSYLYRTEEDVRGLIARRANLRLCKGAYMEPKEVAFPEKADVDANYKKLLGLLLGSGSYVGIATHDLAMIDEAKRLISERRLDAGFEFQMLYGVRRDLQDKLRQEGYRVRVYIPYGSDWCPYFMRRLAERPANVLFVLKNLWRDRRQK